MTTVVIDICPVPTSGPLGDQRHRDLARDYPGPDRGAPDDRHTPRRT